MTADYWHIPASGQGILRNRSRWRYGEAWGLRNCGAMQSGLKFAKGDTIIPAEAVYPSGALTVDGYEPDGTLLAHLRSIYGGHYFSRLLRASFQFDD